MNEIAYEVEMYPQTDGVNVSDWLQATKGRGIKILPSEPLDLNLEFQAWDDLSDEALINFDRRCVMNEIALGILFLLTFCAGLYAGVALMCVLAITDDGDRTRRR